MKFYEWTNIEKGTISLQEWKKIIKLALANLGKQNAWSALNSAQTSNNFLGILYQISASFFNCFKKVIVQL